RLWPIDPLTDQEIGGLITWIPASMMSLAALLILWARWIHEDARIHARRTQRTPPAIGPARRLQ
ncbi:MAG: cytochrome c oxidase assembly protein, partial [Terriglobales bacterium]